LFYVIINYGGEKMLNNGQEKAIEVLYQRAMRRELVSVLQGYAGTGKSFLISFLQRELGLTNKNSHFCAYTGTAAKLLANRGLSASTIHSLIYKPIFMNDTVIGFEKVPRASLAHLKMIFVDEYSMVPQDLLDDLLYYEIPIILIGDPFQLPAIGAPNIYMNRSDASLTEVVRQALDNPILWAATRIRQGEPLLNGLYGDILYVGRRISADENWFRKDVQVLTGTNKTRNEINLQIAGSPFPGRGDKIIFLKNDKSTGITNGTIAELTSINKRRGLFYSLSFITDCGLNIRNYMAEFRDQSFPKNQFFDFAYAISVHKAQGQTIDDKGIIIDESRFFEEHKSQHLYVALTRFTGKHNVALLR